MHVGLRYRFAVIALILAGALSHLVIEKVYGTSTTDALARVSNHVLDEARERPEREWRADRFAEICAQLDCSRIPERHALIVFGDDHILFPLFSKSSHKCQVYPPTDRSGVEYDRNNMVVRSVDILPSRAMSFVLTCLGTEAPSWWSAFDLGQIWLSSEFGPMRTFNASRDPLNDAVRRDLVNRNRVSVSRSFDDVSHVDTVWRPPRHAAGEWSVFLSKQPMFQGSHVVVSCRAACEIFTANINDEEKSKGIQFYVHAGRHGPKSRECDDHIGTAVCSKVMHERLEDLADFVMWLDLKIDTGRVD